MLGMMRLDVLQPPARNREAKGSEQAFGLLRNSKFKIIRHLRLLFRGGWV